MSNVRHTIAEQVLAPLELVDLAEAPSRCPRAPTRTHCSAIRTEASMEKAITSPNSGRSIKKSAEISLPPIHKATIMTSARAKPSSATIATRPQVQCLKAARTNSPGARHGSGARSACGDEASNSTRNRQWYAQQSDHA